MTVKRKKKGGIYLGLSTNQNEKTGQLTTRPSGNLPMTAMGKGEKLS